MQPKSGRAENGKAHKREIEEKGEYILPARFDNTPIPGLLDTVGYIDLSETTPQQLCDLSCRQTGETKYGNTICPLLLDRLFE